MFSDLVICFVFLLLIIRLPCRIITHQSQLILDGPSNLFFRLYSGILINSILDIEICTHSYF